MPRFRISEDNISNGAVELTGTDVKHIKKVLRYSEGDQILLFSDNREYKGIIEHAGSKTVTVSIKESFLVHRESSLNINVYQGLLKSSNMELVIQKLTELGVKSIIPVNNDRSQLINTNKIPRWKKIAEESCKQCGRNNPVKIEEVVKPYDIKPSDQNDTLWICFDPRSNTMTDDYFSARNAPDTVNILIGPEGGFNDHELDLFRSMKIGILKLGPRILRAETASIAAVSIIQYLFGDL